MEKVNIAVPAKLSRIKLTGKRYLFSHKTAQPICLKRVVH
jgi:hypothetical protein